MNKDAINIRRAAEADVGAIVALNDQLFQEDSGTRDPLVNHAWAREHGAAYFGGMLERASYICLVAEAQGAVIGYLAGHTRDANDYRPAITAELESICVAPAWRSRGAGEQLVRAFLSWAQERGAAFVTVTAYAANERALAFYARAGFTPHTVTLGLRLP
ncbi:MAG: GNAT family N-acetyltransferase [Chloroflexota bacterium]